MYRLSFEIQRRKDVPVPVFYRLMYGPVSRCNLRGEMWIESPSERLWCVVVEGDNKSTDKIADFLQLTYNCVGKARNVRWDTDIEKLTLDRFTWKPKDECKYSVKSTGSQRSGDQRAVGEPNKRRDVRDQSEKPDVPNQPEEPAVDQPEKPDVQNQPEEPAVRDQPEKPAIIVDGQMAMEIIAAIGGILRAEGRVPAGQRPVPETKVACEEARRNHNADEDPACAQGRRPGLQRGEVGITQVPETEDVTAAGDVDDGWEEEPQSQALEEEEASSEEVEETQFVREKRREPAGFKKRNDLFPDDEDEESQSLLSGSRKRKYR